MTENLAEISGTDQIDPERRGILSTPRSISLVVGVTDFELMLNLAGTAADVKSARAIAKSFGISRACLA